METWSLLLLLQGNCRPAALSSRVGQGGRAPQKFRSWKNGQGCTVKCLAPKSSNAGALQRICTIILCFRGEGLHIWHLTPNTSLCISRVCYVLRRALASTKILMGFLPRMRPSRKSSWRGVHSKAGCPLLGNACSAVSSAHGTCADRGACSNDRGRSPTRSERSQHSKPN